MTGESYHIQFGSFMSKVKDYTCQLCQSTFIHSADGLRNHFQKHGLTAMEYYKKFVQESVTVEDQEMSMNNSELKEQDLTPLRSSTSLAQMSPNSFSSLQGEASK